MPLKNPDAYYFKRMVEIDSTIVGPVTDTWYPLIDEIKPAHRIRYIRIWQINTATLSQDLRIELTLDDGSHTEIFTANNADYIWFFENVQSASNFEMANSSYPIPINCALDGGKTVPDIQSKILIVRFKLPNAVLAGTTVMCSIWYEELSRV